MKGYLLKVWRHKEWIIVGSFCGLLIFRMFWYLYQFLYHARGELNKAPYYIMGVILGGIVGYFFKYLSGYLDSYPFWREQKWWIIGGILWGILHPLIYIDHEIREIILPEAHYIPPGYTDLLFYVFLPFFWVWAGFLISGAEPVSAFSLSIILNVILCGLLGLLIGKRFRAITRRYPFNLKGVIWWIIGGVSWAILFGKLMVHTLIIIFITSLEFIYVIAEWIAGEPDYGLGVFLRDLYLLFTKNIKFISPVTLVALLFDGLLRSLQLIKEPIPLFYPTLLYNLIAAFFSGIAGCFQWATFRCLKIVRRLFWS